MKSLEELQGIIRDQHERDIDSLLDLIERSWPEPTPDCECKTCTSLKLEDTD